jgi:hypothetical protein
LISGWFLVALLEILGQFHFVMKIFAGMIWVLAEDLKALALRL